MLYSTTAAQTIYAYIFFTATQEVKVHGDQLALTYEDEDA